MGLTQDREPQKEIGTIGSPLVFLMMFFSSCFPPSYIEHQVTHQLVSSYFDLPRPPFPLICFGCQCGTGVLTPDRLPACTAGLAVNAPSDGAQRGLRMAK